jgi:hypothetical protein
MSHFTRLQTRLVDAGALVKALADMGFAHVEVHDQPQHLFGYRGDRRPETAEVIVRRKYIGSASNDIGFQRQPDGSFTAIISGFDRRKYSPKWLAGLTQRYAYHLASAKLQEQGFDLVSEEKAPDGQIRLVLRRMA